MRRGRVRFISMGGMLAILLAMTVAAGVKAGAEPEEIIGTREYSCAAQRLSAGKHGPTFRGTIRVVFGKPREAGTLRIVQVNYKIETPLGPATPLKGFVEWDDYPSKVFASSRALQDGEFYPLAVDAYDRPMHDAPRLSFDFHFNRTIAGRFAAECAGQLPIHSPHGSGIDRKLQEYSCHTAGFYASTYFDLATRPAELTEDGVKPAAGYVREVSYEIGTPEDVRGGDEANVTVHDRGAVPHPRRFSTDDEGVQDGERRRFPDSDEYARIAGRVEIFAQFDRRWSWDPVCILDLPDIP